MTKCFICKKKINNILVDIHTCKCENIYCGNHLDANNHNCSFDYRKNYKNIIKDKLPLVVFDKIDIDF